MNGIENVRNACNGVRNVKTKLWVMWYLLDHPCVDCGESNPIVLEFDHVRGEKTADISTLKSKGKLAAIKREIPKCEVRCANCHRRITYRRLMGLEDDFCRIPAVTVREAHGSMRV